MQNKKKVILVTWRNTGKFEIFKDLGKLYSVYSKDDLGVSRRLLHNYDLMEKEYITRSAIIQKLYVN